MLFLKRVKPLPTRTSARNGTQMHRFYFNLWIREHIANIKVRAAKLDGSGYVRGGFCEAYDIIDIYCFKKRQRGSPAIGRDYSGTKRGGRRRKRRQGKAKIDTNKAKFTR